MARYSKHIRRVDSEIIRTHAWVVQVQRENRSTIKMFSDAVHGGKRKALAAAKAFHAGLTNPLGEFSHQMWRRSIVRRNNKSGIVGVSRYVRRDNGIASWMASWTDPTGRNRTRKFSTRLWGERGAKQKAIEVRRVQLLRMVALSSGVQGASGMV